MMKAAMLALVALAMLVAASIVSVAESVVTQKVANRANVITKFPGCVILGHHDWKDSPMSRDFAEDAHVDGVVSAGACQDICFESWKNSKFRGIQVYNSASYQAIFRHEGCYVEDTAR
ncbi:Hypothetical Protein FCC1311_114622 [Hondaea fermentalgiana]|uniref:Uncharacterized protein n=1 Tax=Hondaea fermentalgiana TaxID=2315210 RepID=A0A2R5GY38_9STRA|nr:Hypothetical Protein FCC1311_114622 [Hondaea fermentalgiana]|eukprot:GBG35239.1 Hypothetical Protein FCC1311_114622 [Hondaea fermentalgiana]